MQLFTFFTTAAILTMASLSFGKDECQGVIEEDAGRCAQGTNVFCHIDYPGCAFGLTQTFDGGLTQKNEEVCAHKELGEACIRKSCCFK
ncbi:unnamed protein product [Diplocarpon coronariae]